MRVALGSDHAGFDLKTTCGLDAGVRGDTRSSTSARTTPRDSVDYPDFGEAVGRAVAVGSRPTWASRSAGAGIGISIAANKVPGVRAALAHDATSARLAREHNHANVLCLGARLIGAPVAVDALEAWLTATPGEGRHLRRHREAAPRSTRA